MCLIKETCNTCSVGVPPGTGLGTTVVILASSQKAQTLDNTREVNMLEKYVLEMELCKTLNQLNHCVAKCFTVSELSVRLCIANHLIQIETSKHVLQIISFRL